MNNGQACVALTRILLPRSRYDELAEAMSRGRLRPRRSTSDGPATQVGPLVARRQRCPQPSTTSASAGRRGAKRRCCSAAGVPKGPAGARCVRQEPALFGGVTNACGSPAREIFPPRSICLLRTGTRPRP
ncbi:aldehyde dehydrogenase family protein [Streptomyces sp. KL116D]|uniref:aldehyde dehydrogenase family protein n=1 Tax=Streptomyces sp. KL116D TaxID=3045152 RepID=UPI003555F921